MEEGSPVDVVAADVVGPGGANERSRELPPSTGGAPPVLSKLPKCCDWLRGRGLSSGATVVCGTSRSL